MSFDKRYIAALALTGCAVALSTYVSRRRNLRVKARELQNALEVWENEGGILRAEDAADIEQAEGEWLDGDWVDFDPVTAPRLVKKQSIDSVVGNGVGKQ